MQKTSRRKRAYRLIDRVFRSEKKIKVAIVEARNTMPRKTDDGGHPSKVSDPTAAAAVKALTEIPSVHVDDDFILHRPESWLDVIRQTYANSGTAEREVMELYYRGYNAIEIACQNRGYSEQTVYYILNAFRQLAAEIACQYGLVRVVDDRE